MQQKDNEHLPASSALFTTIHTKEITDTVQTSGGTKNHIELSFNADFAGLGSKEKALQQH